MWCKTTVEAMVEDCSMQHFDKISRPNFSGETDWN